MERSLHIVFANVFMVLNKHNAIILLYVKATSDVTNLDVIMVSIQVGYLKYPTSYLQLNM
jgi:hypothetical protein